MTTYAFSTLADQQTIAFDPNADVLNFDNAFASAGAYRLVSASNGTRAQWETWRRDAAPCAVRC